MGTAIAVDVETDQIGSTLEDQHCHLRRRYCPSVFSLCGVVKPWRHDLRDDMAQWRERRECRVCGKPTCPKCVEIALATLTSPCPSCGGGC